MNLQIIISFSKISISTVILPTQIISKISLEDRILHSMNSSNKRISILTNNSSSYLHAKNTRLTIISSKRYNNFKTAITKHFSEILLASISLIVSPTYEEENIHPNYPNNNLCFPRVTCCNPPKVSCSSLTACIRICCLPGCTLSSMRHSPECM